MLFKYSASFENDFAYKFQRKFTSWAPHEMGLVEYNRLHQDAFDRLRLALMHKQHFENMKGDVWRGYILQQAIPKWEICGDTNIVPF